MKYAVIAAAVVAASAFAVSPASSKMTMCSGDHLSKMTAMVGGMPDGPQKWEMYTPIMRRIATTDPTVTPTAKHSIHARIRHRQPVLNARYSWGESGARGGSGRSDTFLGIFEVLGAPARPEKGSRERRRLLHNLVSCGRCAEGRTTVVHVRGRPHRTHTTLIMDGLGTRARPPSGGPQYIHDRELPIHAVWLKCHLSPALSPLSIAGLEREIPSSCLRPCRVS